jgi:uncharacterized membrane protein YraQ (UPF0718 family)
MERGETSRPRLKYRAWFFPLGVAVVYLVIYATSSDRAVLALMDSGKVLRQIALPLFLAFLMMMILNWSVSPARVRHYLGGRAGIKGIFLSSLAGIVSMGPLVAWLPFLSAIREKGGADFHLANFLSSRAVKPVLLPVMIGYFGWRFSIVFTALNLVGALLVAVAVGFVCRGRQDAQARNAGGAGKPGR